MRSLFRLLAASLLIAATTSCLGQEEIDYFDQGCDFSGQVALLRGPDGRLCVVTTQRSPLSSGRLELHGRPSDDQRFGWEGRGGSHTLLLDADGSITLHWHIDVANTPGYWDVDLSQRPDGRVRLSRAPTDGGRTLGEPRVAEARSIDAMLEGNADAARVLAGLLPRMTSTPRLPHLQVLLAHWLPGKIEPVPQETALAVQRLDGPDFRDREAASRDLRSAEPVRTVRALRRLRQAGSLSPEQRSRVDALLADPLGNAPPLLRLVVTWEAVHAAAAATVVPRPATVVQSEP
jgi:hypothetical protein